MRIYTDLDNVLVNPVLTQDGEYVKRIDVRRGCEWFLENLSRYGQVFLLSMAMRDHVKRCLAAMGWRAVRHFVGFITREHLSVVEEQISVIRTAEVSDEERQELLATIRPIAPKGVVFDDYPVGSEIFMIKASAVGIGPESWIEVEPFMERVRNDKGLFKAYEEFKNRFLEAV